MKFLRYSFPLLCKLSKNCINIERFSHFTSISIYCKKWTFLVTTSSKYYAFIHSFPFHTTTLKCTKQFQERENEYAHDAMENFSKHFSSMANETKQMVFVYGTLKKGEPNHYLIEKSKEGKAVFLSNGQTVKKWPLVIASRYNIPYLLYCEGKGMHVIGELYEIDDIMLAKMDELECHPDYYTRIKEDVYIISEKDSKELVKPWIYFLKNFRSKLLELKFLPEYSSKGSHGLEYISRYKRPHGENYYSDVMNL